MANAVKDAVTEKISVKDYPNETSKEPKRSRFWLIASAIVLALATASGAFLWARRSFSSAE